MSNAKLGDEKLPRRGLIAGLAALGAAAAMKLAGADKAEALDGQSIVIGNESQTGQSQTRLTITTALLGPAFQVIRGGVIHPTTGRLQVR
jgi:hypothetical protein